MSGSNGKATVRRFKVDPGGVPEGLKRRRRWICWKIVVRKGQPSKIPCSPSGGSLSWTDPACWLSWEEAYRAYLDNPGIAGVGIVLGDGLCGYDRDDCLGPDGSIDAEGADHLRRLGTFCEISPSGQGIKAYLFGPEALPDGKRGRNEPGDPTEWYTGGRWFAVTGMRLDGYPAEPVDAGDAFSALYRERYPTAEAEAAPERKARIKLKPRINGKAGPGAPAGDPSRWAAAALAEELAAVESAPEGTRNDRLNEAAFSLGQIVGAGALGERQVEGALLDAAEACGLPEGEARRTVRSGIVAGKAKPRDLSGVGIKARPKPKDEPEPEPEPEATVGPPPSSNGKHAPPAEPKPGRKRTEFGLAERYHARFWDRVRFCHPWGKFLIWDGRRWLEDSKAKARRLAKETVRRLYAEAAKIKDAEDREEFIKWAVGCERKRVIDATLSLVSHEDGIPVTPDEMDRDPGLLNVLNGTIDLRSGELRPHDRADLMTKLAPVAFDPDAECPLWIATLNRIFGGRDGLIRFFQSLCGYILTGEVGEQILPILHGAGSNGKSTIINALLEMLGDDYAMKAPHDFLMVRKGDRHLTEMADLFGKRLVVASETGEGCRINEPLIKELTGSEPIRARRMREDSWQFPPSHKVMLCTNHRPQIRGTDHAIWRRIRLIPFTVIIPDEEQDKALPAKLRVELPGILAWCVRGCLRWRRDGLAPPEEVAEATGQYRKEEDVLQAFLDEHCFLGPSFKARASDLYGRYKAWAEGSGEFVLSQTKFGKALTERGYEKGTSNGTWYKGLGLRETEGERTQDPV